MSYLYINSKAKHNINAINSIHSASLQNNLSRFKNIKSPPCHNINAISNISLQIPYILLQ